jgi:PAS domain S-box-containing protein
VLDASPNAIVAVDSRGLITYVNPQVLRTFGYRGR